MNERRYEALTTWLETHRERVDVERGLVWAKDGTHAVGTQNGRGYLRVMLARANYAVHEVIAVAGGLDIRGCEVNHRDGDKTRNALSNLEPVSHTTNIRHALATGLIPCRAGEHASRARLTWRQVDAIRAAYRAGGASQATLAARYGVHQATISKIVRGDRWTGADLPLAS